MASNHTFKIHSCFALTMYSAPLVILFADASCGLISSMIHSFTYLLSSYYVPVTKFKQCHNFLGRLQNIYILLLYKYATYTTVGKKCS